MPREIGLALAKAPTRIRQIAPSSGDGAVPKIESPRLIATEYPDAPIPHTAMNVQMPGMTGLDLHRHLSASEKPIPTILITAYPDGSARERAVAAGVIGYLSKPFDENDLLACIRSALTNA